MGQDYLALRIDSEGALAEVDAVGIRFDQVGPQRTARPSSIHEIGAEDAVREAVLHMGGGHQLTPWDASPLKASAEGAGVGAGSVDGGCNQLGLINDHQVLDMGTVCGH